MQLALADLHLRIDHTYFRPTFVGWVPASAASVTTAATGGARGPAGRPSGGRRRPVAGLRRRCPGAPTSSWPRRHGAGPLETGGRELAGSAPSGLASRRDELARLLRNEGATYNVTRDDQAAAGLVRSTPCPWSLDPAEWAGLERRWPSGWPCSTWSSPTSTASGASSRGAWSPELVLGHPAFLRAVRGIDRPGAHRLFLTAVDVVRDAHGGFRAVGDRAQAPSGLGYALVNRRPCPGCCPRSTGRRASSGWPASSGPSGPASPRPPPRAWTSPGW